MKLTFELKPPHKQGELSEIEIFLDREGLDSLCAQLDFLKSGATNAVNLMSPSWGLHHLTEDKVGSDNKLIHHVAICLIHGTE